MKISDVPLLEYMSFFLVDILGGQRRGNVVRSKETKGNKNWERKNEKKKEREITTKKVEF